ncbi:MAG: hypothetical protein M3320_00510 [Actinomycetota bacterium]|nr:hypothetical protein [Actinomycetota bacterium]MDQ5807136.1 hypothetical protein [Actinomycetota bacterium]
MRKATDISTCPDASEILERLEGSLDAQESQAVDLHLEGCAACAALRSTLEERALPVALPDRRAELRRPQQWVERRRESVAQWDLWLLRTLAPPELASLGRMPVVVLTKPFQEYGSGWVEVAPVATDPQRASSSHAVLAAAESHVEQPLRVLTELAVVVPNDTLDAWIGELAAAARERVSRVLEGRAEPGDVGVPLTGTDDPRAERDEPLVEAVLELRRPYAEAVEAALLEEAVEPDDPGSVVIPADFGPRIELMTHEFALAAAANTGPGPLVGEWRGVVPVRLRQGERTTELSVQLGPRNARVEVRNGPPVLVGDSPEPLPPGGRRTLLIADRPSLSVLVRREPLTSELKRVLRWA